MSNKRASGSPSEWRVLEERVVYENLPWLRMREQDVQLPSGVIIEKYLLTEVPDVVMVFALTGTRQVLFVEQYKHGLRRLSLDLVAGYVDRDDPSPLSAAQRELREEAGYTSERWEHLASLSPDPNRSGAQYHFFIALDCRRAGEQRLDPTEDLHAHLIPLEELDWLVPRRPIYSLATTAGIALAMRYLERLAASGKAGGPSAR